MNDRFLLQPSKFMPGWWVLTDTVNLVVITFKEHRFNDTQKVTDIEGNLFTSMSDVMTSIRVVREMSDWLAVHHYKIAMP